MASCSRRGFPLGRTPEETGPPPKPAGGGRAPRPPPPPPPPPRRAAHAPVGGEDPGLPHAGHPFLQQAPAVRAAVAVVLRGEVLADVRQAGGAAQRAPDGGQPGTRARG